MSSPLLDIRRLSMTFPGVRALDEVALSVRDGEIVALVGQNGSGKSTLVKVLAGLHAPDPGSEIALGVGPDGSQVSLHFIHQDLGLVANLSTIENLDLSRAHRHCSLLPTPRQERRHAEQLIAAFGASFNVTHPISKLSLAERTIVAIARALDGWNHPANVLVLDEPTVSLHGDEVQKLFFAVREVADRGAGVIFISHRLDEVMELADRVVVLRDGQLIADVKRGGFNHDELVRLIAGEMASAHTGHGHPERGAPVLRARAIQGATIRTLDLDIHAGEVVGISGVLGSGREEVATILFGNRTGTVKDLQVGGRRLAVRGPRESIAAGMAYVPADRHRHGAVMTMNARENMTLPQLRSLRRRFSRLDRRGEQAEVHSWLGRVNVRPPESERQLALFSGGNQQKIVLAKWLRNRPTVLLLDEPTQGVDVAAKAGLFDLIAGAASAGAGVLISSSDTKELSLVCDRVLVMRDGELAAEVSKPDLSEARLVSAALQPAQADR
jgi:ribose transport system ATP-binding protein